MAQRKVAIVGWASSSREEAPWEDPSWEIWACNQMGMRLPDHRYTRWYELHAIETLERAGLGEDLKWQKAQPQPCYMHGGRIEEFPNAAAYPFAEVIEWVDDYMPGLLHGKPYATSSISWMFLHALYEHALTSAPWSKLSIGLWGVDMSMATEHGYQRPCCEAYLAFAAGLGVDLFVHEASSLFKAPYVYALEEVPGELDICSARVISEVQQEMAAKYKEQVVLAAKYQGAQDMCQRFVNMHIEARRKAGLAAAIEISQPKAKPPGEVQCAADRH